jgi:hypothetical protein
MLRVVIYYLLNSISTLGDSIFLYFVSMTLLQNEQGGMLCSIVLGMDAFLEIIIGPYMARFIDSIPEITMRLRRSVVIQLGLLLLAFIPALLMLGESKISHLLVTLALMRFFILMDNQFKSALPLSLDRKERIPLVRTISLSTFSQRSIFLVSSALAPLLIHHSWLFACSLNSFTYLFACLALILIMKVTKQSGNAERRAEDHSTYYESEKKRWMGWTSLYYFLSNFAFGGVVLILTKSMLQADGNSYFFQALMGPSPLYAGLLLSLVLMLIYHHKVGSMAKTPGRLCFINMILGVGLITTASLAPTFQILSLFVIGVVNGFSIVASDAFLQRTMEGKGFVKAVAKTQACGRAGFLLSLVSIGFCIDCKFSSNQMLAVAGVVAFLFSLILFLLALPLVKVYSIKKNA